MAATDRDGSAGTSRPDGPAGEHDVERTTTEDSPGANPAENGAASGDEPLTADLAARPPRISTRVLLAIALVLVVALLVSLVVAFVILHQPHLTPAPVPSVSSIA